MYLRPSIQGSLVLASVLLVHAATALAGPFVFASLPDTQVYSENRPPFDGRTPATTYPEGTGAIFFEQTEWLVENADALEIRYVGHLGDIVQRGDNLTEWDLGKQAMNVLIAGDMPHGTVMGNHDDIESHPEGYAANYLTNFGPQVFEGFDWYMGASPYGGANWQLLEHDRYKIGFINFSIDQPRDEVLWAQEVVEQNPDTIFVIGTHRYMYDFKIGGGRYYEEVNTPLGVFNVQDDFVPGAINPTSAEDFFNQFVSQNENILMIHAGHFHSEWLRLDGLDREQKLIIQILTDYQSTRNGGDGWLRLYELDFENDEFRFDTYSPIIGRPRTTIDHYVETIFLAWDQRDQIRSVLGISEAEYLFLLELGFKRSGAIPDGFLRGHPDFDEPEERAYYQQYLDELFLGDPPPGFSNIEDFELLWQIGFAADPDDLSDFSDGPRSPQGKVSVSFMDYFTPNASQLSGWALDDLGEAMAALGAADLRGWLGRQLERRIEIAQWLGESGLYRLAEWVLQYFTLPLVDGCADRGRPDPNVPWFLIFFGAEFPDAVKTCDAQATIHPEMVEAISVLDSIFPCAPGGRGVLGPPRSLGDPPASAAGGAPRSELMPAHSGRPGRMGTEPKQRRTPRWPARPPAWPLLGGPSTEAA